MQTAAIPATPLRPTLVVAHSAKAAYIAPCATTCSTCALRRLCVPSGLNGEPNSLIDELVTTRKRVRRGEHVYRANDRFTTLFAFRTGFYKAYVESEDGRTHVTGFHMAGDVAGFDGIGTERHRQNLVALEDGEVCLISYPRLEATCSRVPSMQRYMYKMLSSEIVREQELMLLLGTMRAEARVGAFLLNLSQRFAQRGYSSVEFILRMTREEIGSYLGLKLETVSRIFSRLQEEGVLQVQGRAIKLLDMPALSELVGLRDASTEHTQRSEDLYKVGARPAAFAGREAAIA
ncbi:MAG TPA: helix-turn-helix domain-containing protein [Casimicrobiaceae bacterium]|nr:helix-turn-helix domain-containing protein [Casimicrobiaceae bacterium]